MVLRFDAKLDFMKSDHAKAYREFMASSVFNSGSTAALLHYGDNLSLRTQEEAEVRFHKLQGAREFLGVLLNLTEEPDKPTPPIVKQLNPRA